MLNNPLCDAKWCKSSYSGGAHEDCVQLAHVPGVIGVRDSKNPGGPVLSFNLAEWRAFIAEVKRTG
jgi:Domain of unknown function (DUF397).